MTVDVKSMITEIEVVVIMMVDGVITATMREGGITGIIVMEPGS